MGEEKKIIGSIQWRDLTVPAADDVRDFYEAVVGWTSDPLDMGGYSDYCMKNEEGEVVAGVCHARGVNAGLPAVWLMYITVADLDASMEQVMARGGKVLAGPKTMGPNRYCVIQDPAGAVAALYQPGA
jgi:predicted enzyme related to lactoylglutathione lyase